MLKIPRFFWSGYTPEYDKLYTMGYKIMRLQKPIISVNNEDQGFGQVNGVIKKLGANYSPVPICIFKRSNRTLLWETKSESDGSYRFRNIKKGLECFVIAFDPKEEYNAVISDKVVAK